MKFFLACWLLCITTVGRAQTPDLIDSLARSVSGLKGQPVCKADTSDAGAAGSTCQWVQSAEIASKGTVTTTRYTSDAALLSWERPTRNIKEASQLVDSLGRALSDRKLSLRGCGQPIPKRTEDARAWEGKDLVVYVSELLQNRGDSKLIILATTDPKAIPDVICSRKAM